MTYGYLGPAGTFSEAAASKYWPEADQFKAADSIPDLFRLLRENTVTDILVPFENSSAGIIRNSLAGLISFPLSIRGELEVQVEQHLMAPVRYSLEEIELVISQPTALLQCETYIQTHLPGVRLEITDSTARAAQMVAQEKRRGAAIGHYQAARHYNLEIIASSIQQDNNRTRFLHLTHKCGLETKGNKCSIIFEVPNKPGALYRVLGVFAERQLNLSKIESYPLPGSHGYRFYVETDIPENSFESAKLMEQLSSGCTSVSYLGSYYRCEEEPL